MNQPETSALLRLTLDTNCVIHAVAGQGYAADVEELTKLCGQGWAELWLTTAFDEDQENAGDERRAANLRWINEHPITGWIPQPLLLDYSRLGNSALADDRTAEAGKTIAEILLPAHLRGSLAAGDDRLMAKWRKRVKDVQHLSSHFMFGHDVFVTSDDDDMIKKRDELRRRTGIVIDNPAEAVLRIRNHIHASAK